jgi:hypothetical protein
MRPGVMGSFLDTGYWILEIAGRGLTDGDREERGRQREIFPPPPPPNPTENCLAQMQSVSKAASEHRQIRHPFASRCKYRYSAYVSPSHEREHQHNSLADGAK